LIDAIQALLVLSPDEMELPKDAGISTHIDRIIHTKPEYQTGTDVNRPGRKQALSAELLNPAVSMQFVGVKPHRRLFLSAYLPRFCLSVTLSPKRLEAREWARLMQPRFKSFSTVVLLSPSGRTHLKP